MTCRSNGGYSDKFYINIEDNYGITDSKEMNKICVKCDKLTECKKREVYQTLLDSNKEGNE